LFAEEFFEAAVAEAIGIIVVVNLSKVKPGLRNEGPVRFAVCHFPFVSLSLKKMVNGK